MTVIKSSEEVYNLYLREYGIDKDGDPDAIALFAYALVEKEKFEWMEHYRESNGGSSPTPLDIESWYANKPSAYFEDKSKYAVAWYRSFARSLLEDEIEYARKEAIKEYIGDKLKFFPQLWVSLASNVIFIFLLGALAMYVVADFSPISWVEHHLGHTLRAPPAK